MHKDSVNAEALRHCQYDRRAPMGEGDGGEAAWTTIIYTAYRVECTSNQLIGELAQMVERLLSKGLWSSICGR